jgi:HicA toxin of bacterial toxin-antitoxin,
MSKGKKLLEKARRGSSLSFDELVQLAMLFGFVLVRVKGSHHIFKHEDVEELLNLQNVKGAEGASE